MSSSNLPVPSGGLFPDRYQRKLDKATGRELALVRAHELVAADKIAAIEAVGHTALGSVATLSAVELAYAQRDPRAAPRLRFVADEATLAITRRIQRFERNLG